MKEHIYTIPVIEGFKKSGECPFCNMYDELNKNAIEFMLGPSYMEESVRMDTDRTGFCQRHYIEMYGESNRLGLALMVHTHMRKVIKELETLTKSDLASDSAKKKKTLFAKKGESTSVISEYLRKVEASCYICDKINNNFEHFLDTFFYLWKTDGHIKDFVGDSNGFCNIHFAMIIEQGEKKLNPKDYSDFLSIILPKQLENLKRVEADIDWFIKKFDYRNGAEPWKSSRDALPRALRKISAVNLETDKKDEEKTIE